MIVFHTFISRFSIQIEREINFLRNQGTVLFVMLALVFLIFVLIRQWDSATFRIT